MNSSPSAGHSLAIRHEIQRFESVHPSIYAIYDLIDLVPDPMVAQQVRDHVVCIEDSFVNSQEWTLSRNVPDLRLGILGSLSSGKSALVHRYLTGSYMQEESPEGGRFKKEVVVDGQSHLLLIRDEGGPPEAQFAAWVDAIVFVFSLENEASFHAVYSYYTQMAHFRNSAEVPLILVGTQDAISENNPRVIDDARARKLAADLKRCSYYETCATYGLNVERVFQDACQKIVQQRLNPLAPLGSAVAAAVAAPPPTPTPTSSRPSTPSHHPHHHSFPILPPPPTSSSLQPLLPPPAASSTNTGSSSTSSNASAFIPSSLASTASNNSARTPSFPLPGMVNPSSLIGSAFGSSPAHHRHHTMLSQPHRPTPSVTSEVGSQEAVGSGLGSSPPARPSVRAADDGALSFARPALTTSSHSESLLRPPASKEATKDLPTPSSTPTTSRKSRRRSNLFTPSKKGDFRNGSVGTGGGGGGGSGSATQGGEVGSGRAIPLKQGHLYKRSSKALNKDWKKKYVTLCDDARLTYHPSLHDYMDDVHGKEISLQYVTVKVPGQKPRGSKSVLSSTTAIGSSGGGIGEGLSSLSLVGKDKKLTDKVLLTAFEILKEPGARIHQTCSNEDAMLLGNSSQSFLNGGDNKMETPNVKKRHRRMKSSGMRNTECDDSDGYEFFIVSLDNKQWHFEASNSEERDEWVDAIQQQILKSLQGNESTKSKVQQNNLVDAASVQSIRLQLLGNTHCVDCDAPNPDWASLNLGVLMCIECSGIHRNLGSHISRVRSLGLDEWPPGHMSVMLAIGNYAANEIWEANTNGRAKPTPNSSREEKERWIRSKYEQKEFLAVISSDPPFGEQLVDAVCRSDMKAVALLLAHSNSPEQVNATVSSVDLRTPLHLACAMGNLAMAQLLIWNNADIKAADHEGRTCLSHARMASISSPNLPMPMLASTGSLVELLMMNGCPEAAASREGGLGRRGPPPPEAFDRLPSSVI
ncbi:centaurin-gamma-1A [Hetaerina americana]|uniref:centaurin-gamma-1A n=1 Tax=Hetaerina americana TaxID=62018 RepID=UPI003A7F2137